MNALRNLFCIKYGLGTAKKRKHILYFAVELITENVDMNVEIISNKGQNLFITGPGGSSKSKLINDFVLHSAKMNNSTQVTALTGCAAILLGNSAKTIHS